MSPRRVNVRRTGALSLGLSERREYSPDIRLACEDARRESQ